MGFLVLSSAACHQETASRLCTSEEVDGVRTVVNSPVADWDDVPSGRLGEFLRIGAVEGRSFEMFGSVSGLDVSTEGVVAVLDAHSKSVRLFSQDGSYLRTVGRPGEGPGELATPISVHFDQAGRIWIADIGRQLYHVFDVSGEFLTAHQRLSGIVLGNPATMTDAGLLDPNPRITSAGTLALEHILVDTAGNVVDTVPALSGMGAGVARLQGLPVSLAAYVARTFSKVTPAGGIWRVVTSDYDVVLLDASADTLVRAEMETPSLDLDRGYQPDSLFGRWREALEEANAELGWPKIRSIHADEDGRLFVRPMVGPEDGSVYDVFSQGGCYMGRVEWGERFAERTPVAFRDGKVYGVVTDELGVAFVVGADVSLPPGAREPVVPE